MTVGLRYARAPFVHGYDFIKAGRYAIWHNLLELSYAYELAVHGPPLTLFNPTSQYVFAFSFAASPWGDSSFSFSSP